MTVVDKVSISAKITHSINSLLNSYARELQVSKSWIIQQALRQYFERYDEHLSDLRIASLSETVSHEEVLEEYGVQD